jgi:hypothetical protein
MLKSRLEADRLGKLYDLGPQPRNEAGEVLPPEEATLPDEVIVKMLGREVLLTEAKLHVLQYEHTLAERSLRSANAQIRQVGAVSVCCCAQGQAMCYVKSYRLRIDDGVPGTL